MVVVELTFYDRRYSFYIGHLHLSSNIYIPSTFYIGHPPLHFIPYLLMNITKCSFNTLRGVLINEKNMKEKVPLTACIICN